MEEINPLEPPMFTPTERLITATEAILSGKWLGSGNVWIYRYTDTREMEFLYQERQQDSPWMPGKLDVAAGGYLKSGEALDRQSRKKGAVRELYEELGLKPNLDDLNYITRRLNVGISQKGNERKSCCDIYAMELTSKYKLHLDPNEVAAVYWIKLSDLLTLHNGSAKTITLERVSHALEKAQRDVSVNDFCPNYDDYLFTMPAMISALVQYSNQQKILELIWQG